MSGSSTLAEEQRKLTQYSVWQAGAKAARAGQPVTDNPYNPIRYEFVCWINGWAFAHHMKCKEDDEL